MSSFKGVVVIFTIGLSIGSCAVTKTNTTKSMDIYGPGVIQNPVIVDLEVNENKVTATNIEQELKLLINNEIEPAIILHTDKTVAIEHVVKIMDIAYRNKYKIVLATTPN